MARWFVAALMMSTSVFAHAPSRQTAVITVVSAPPIVDGSLAEWSPGLFAVSPPLSIETVEEGRVESDADHSAQVWLATTPGFLHFAALVTDDVVQAGESAPDLWRDDGIELIIDRGNGKLWHLGINASGKAWLFQPGGVPEGVTVAVKRSAPGFVVEASIPLKAFRRTDATVSGVSLNVAARDVDGKDVAHRVWSGVQHSARASLGSAVVVKPQPSAVIPACAPSKRVVRVMTPLSLNGTSLVIGSTPITLKLVNYQPAARPWARQWTEFDAEQLARDFAVAAKTGANAIRLFVFYAPFGEHLVKPVMLQRLKTAVELAGRAGLLSVISFFPFDKEFSPKAWPGMGKHLETIVSAFEGNPSIAMWDLMNEPDHSWALPDAGVSARDVSEWAKAMTAVVKKADPSHLVTVGLAGHFALRDGGVEASLPFVDVVSVHGYFDEAQLPALLSGASALGRPVVLQEFGVSRLQYTAAEAAAFDSRVCALARKTGIAGVGAWELFDHPVGSIDWLKEPWREAPENWFGLATSSGVLLPRAQAFCSCLEAPRFSVY